VWPLLLVVCLRSGWKRRSLFGVALLIACTSAVLRSVLWHAGTRGVYYQTDTRADGLLLGCAAAVPWSSKRGRSLLRRWTGLPPAILGVLVLAAAALRIQPTGRATYDGGLFAVALAATIVIVHAVTAERSALTTLLETRAAVWVGARSYGIYLFHIPIFKAVDATALHGTARGWAATTTATALTLAAAALSYTWIETPSPATPRRATARPTSPDGDHRRRSSARPHSTPSTAAGRAELIALGIRLVNFDTPSPNRFERRAGGGERGDN
jgi:peptidoglycan/LPS O-acetylase OafA/YrhL